MTLFASLAAAIALQQPADVDKKLRECEAKLLATIVSQYKLPGSKFYRELIKDGKPGEDIAFLWCHAVQMSAIARGLNVDRPTYEPLWKDARIALDSYGVPKPSAQFWVNQDAGGFAVLPGQYDAPDRYYDDNAWIVWAALDAYAVTHDPEDMKRAVKAYNFALEGFDSKLGGGIYWREREKLSKNACTNTPMAATSFALFRITNDAKYFTMGEHLIAWTKEHLQDKDGLIMDNISIEGKVDRTKWSYNTACYVRALLERERIAPSEANRREANRVLDSAVAHWYTKGSLLMKGPGMFGQHLIDAMFEASEVLGRKELAEFATQSVLAIADQCADANGLYGEDWDRKPRAGEELKLHFIASLLRSVLSARAGTRS